MKINSRFVLVLALVCVGLAACSKVEYDYKALGFADKAEMEAAHAKGYHTKQKLQEIAAKDAERLWLTASSDINTFANQQEACLRWFGQEVYNDERKQQKANGIKESCKDFNQALQKLRSKYADNPSATEALKKFNPVPLDGGESNAPQNQGAASVASSTSAQDRKTETAQASAPKLEQSKSSDTTCSTAKTCADTMLVAARTEKIAQALELAKRIDAMPKPDRGDRKVARKLNKEGLDYLALKKYDEAAAAFIKARVADPVDEEIVANLVYTYSESKQYQKSEQLAYDALPLNPTRSALWLPIAIAKQKQGNASEALQAFWLTWQFSQNKQKLLELIDSKIKDESDATIKALFVNGKSWVIDGKRPTL